MLSWNETDPHYKVTVIPEKRSVSPKWQEGAGGSQGRALGQVDSDSHPGSIYWVVWLKANHLILPCFGRQPCSTEPGTFQGPHEKLPKVKLQESAPVGRRQAGRRRSTRSGPPLRRPASPGRVLGNRRTTGSVTKACLTENRQDDKEDLLLLSHLHRKLWVTHLGDIIWCL